MKFNVLALLALLTISCQAPAQDGITVMSYNVENLFDTEDDPEKDDDEYTPDGDRRWSTKRYWKKMDNLSRVIAAVGEDDAPALVGLCEVENDRVLTDLTTKSPLKNIGYKYVMTDSPDQRGIDVALLYRRGDFRLISKESLRVDMNGTGKGPTRDILHVTGKLQTGDTLDVYVCHWPSRIGGVKESDPYRMKAAKVALKSIEKVFSQRRKPYIVLMGDLNDGPDAPSVRKTLGAQKLSKGASASDRTLVTLMDGQEGSYSYQGSWDSYDQFIVSASLLNGSGCLEATDIRACKMDFLLEDDDKYGGQKPLRTYNGYKYMGGFSDHLPIAFRIQF